jgi:hypothetical protein
VTALVNVPWLELFVDGFNVQPVVEGPLTETIVLAAARPAIMQATKVARKPDRHAATARKRAGRAADTLTIRVEERKTRKLARGDVMSTPPETRV